MITKFEDAMDVMAKYLEKNSDTWVINENLKDKIKKEIEEVKKANLDEASKRAQKKDKESMLKIIQCLEKYAKKKRIDFDFIIIRASQFNSGFGKTDFSDINIAFHVSANEEKIGKVDNIVSSIKAKENAREKFFYLFYRRDGKSNTELDSIELSKILMGKFI